MNALKNLLGTGIDFDKDSYFQCYSVYELALQNHLQTEEIFHVMKQLMYAAKGY